MFGKNYSMVVENRFSAAINMNGHVENLDEGLSNGHKEPNFNDPEGFIDDIDDEELMPDVLKNRPNEYDGMDRIIVVDGIPTVAQDRIEKLKGAIWKIYKEFGPVINAYYPVSEEGITKGYCFLELENRQSAVDAVNTTNNYRLDKNHTFIVSFFSDFEKYENIPSEIEAPVAEPFRNPGDRKYYLLEADACDQYVIVYKGGDEVAVYLNPVRGSGEARELHTKTNWNNTYVIWSPQGSYLATRHDNGVRIWGCEEFSSIMKFPHKNVQLFEFSPCENYLVTASSYGAQPWAQGGSQNESNSIIIWETRTGVKGRTFVVDKCDISRWPIFKWSHNDKYFASLKKDGALSVYETPGFGLLDKKSIKVDRMKDFSWSPTENLLAYWVAEDNEVPARVVLLEMPSRNEIRVVTRSNISNCIMYWQKAGDYLCVKMDRYSKLIGTGEEKKYGGLYHNFEIFHIKEKQIPVDSITIKENVLEFAWDPVGSKFAIIHGETQYQSQTEALSVSFYETKSGQTPVLKKTYDRKSTTDLFWSPAGRHIVLAGLKNRSGVVECVDTSDFTVLNAGETHFMCTVVEWDPTGRYFMTGVSWWRDNNLKHLGEYTYWLWSFQGKILQRFQVDRLCQLLWRPRPPTLLSQKEIKDIKKNLKKYSIEFDAQDKERGRQISEEVLTIRRNIYDEFTNYRRQKDTEFADQKEQRLALRRGIDTDSLVAENVDMEEKVFELFESEQTIILD